MRLKDIIKAASVLLLTFSALTINAADKQYELPSPNDRICIKVHVSDEITFSLYHDGDILIVDSPISMTLSDGTIFTSGKERPKIKKTSVQEIIRPVIYRKEKVNDHYNQLVLSFKKFDLVFRTYNEGAAYRFISKIGGPFEVREEEATFNFPSDFTSFVPYVRDFKEDDFDAQFFNSFENTYSHIKLSEWDSRRMAFLPLLVEADGNRKILLTEADLQNYPGMYLYNGESGTKLKGMFASVPDKVEQGGHNMLQGMVKTRKPHIAEYTSEDTRTGRIEFPWRIAEVSARDAELMDNDMVYCLAEAQDPDMDFSWVKPGKVAWDWWNKWNLYGVDFKTGINNETYKYYIDFASEHNLPYVILDEGWAVNKQADLLQIIPEINLEMLIDYAKERNVGIILWAGYWALNRDLDGLCKHYSEMGVKGFKVDFMDRDDQKMVAFLRKASETAAKYKLMMDFHGTYKPTGLQRTWPNAINYEGVHGLEQMKWCGSSTDQVTYDVTIPFIRMAAGPFDYTQGAMRNANRKNFRAVSSEPMSQGTRCRQLAEYVIFESPFNMLCDSPSNYMREPECTEFISSVPETWDETVALDGKVSDYVAIARRKGNVWYVGAMTDWDERDMTLDLSFLPDGEWEIDVFQDGMNADKAARDFCHLESVLGKEKKLHIHMAPGGGYFARLNKK